MSLKSWIFGEKRPNNYKFSDDDNELGLELRRNKAELKRIKHEKEKIKAEMELESARHELAILKDELYGTEESEEIAETPEKMLMNMMMMNMMKKQGGGIVPNPQQPPPSNKRAYSNPELIAMKQNLPKKALKQAKKMEASLLSPLIRENLPDADEESISRAVKILQE